MIREHPWAGVGVGTFHTLVRDFAMVTTHRPLVPDNAQSWYRHLLAELGLLGSLPWIAWCAVFVATLFSRAAGDRDRFSLGVLRGAFVGFGIIALIGMPGQSLTVIMTFWTLVYWFAFLKGITASPGDATPLPWSKGLWSATLALVGRSCRDHPRRRARRPAATQPLDAFRLGLSLRHQGIPSRFRMAGPAADGRT